MFRSPRDYGVVVNPWGGSQAAELQGAQGQVPEFKISFSRHLLAADLSKCLGKRT